MSKKIKIIFLSAILMILFWMVKVSAATPQALFVGDGTAQPGETKRISLKVTSDEKIGMVSGVISKEGNIANFNVIEKNGWNLTYNEATGAFNINKAGGTNDEEIMDIEYTTTNAEGTGKISINNTKLTDINYHTENKGLISKVITIKKVDQSTEDNSQGEQEIPGGTTTQEGENEGKPEEKQEDETKEESTKTEEPVKIEEKGGETEEKSEEKSNDASSKNQNTENITTSANSTTGTVGTSNSTTSKTTSQSANVVTAKTLPKAGKSDNIIVAIAVIVMGTVISVIGCIKYKEVK